MKYTTQSKVIALFVCIGVGLAMGLARIHLGWFSNVSDIMFSTILGGFAGACTPFVLKPKDDTHD